MIEKRLPDGWDADVPKFRPEDGAMATRKASGTVINAIAPILPEIWGGSADLAESNNTEIDGADSFLPDAHGGTPYGRVLHFGIREHAMGSAMNGIALHGPTRVYGGTGRRVSVGKGLSRPPHRARCSAVEDLTWAGGVFGSLVSRLRYPEGAAPARQRCLVRVSDGHPLQA